MLIYNPSNTNRDVLALARSSDGVHFQAGCNLSLPGAEPGAAYPSVIRGRDGAWRAVYSANAKGRIKFVRFASDWLENVSRARVSAQDFAHGKAFGRVDCEPNFANRR